MLTIYCLFDNTADSVSWQNVHQLALQLGQIFGPLLVKPFLLEIEPTTPGSNDTTIQTNTSELPLRNAGPQPEDVTVMYAYLIAGGLMVLTGFLLLAVSLKLKGKIALGHKPKPAVEAQTETETKELFSLKTCIIVLLLMYYVSQSTFMRTFNNYLVPFAVNHLGWSKTQGSDLATVYFAAGMLGNLLILVIIRFTSLEVIAFSGLAMCNVAALALSFLLDLHNSIMWVFSVLLAIGTSFVMSVLLAWTDKCIGISGFIGVMNGIAGAAGEIIISPFVGYLFDNVSYISLMYLTLASTLLCLVLMIALHVVGQHYVKKKHRIANSQT